MFPCLGFGYGLWWVFPLIMIGMVVLCFFMMRRRMGPMMCRPGFRKSGNHGEDASGEINKEEYEEKKRVITGHN